MQKTKYLLAIGIALALVCSAYLLSLGIRHFQGGDPLVRVTGLSERNIMSDLIILPIQIRALATDQVKAYQDLQTAKDKAMSFLLAQGLDESEINFSSVAVNTEQEEELSFIRNRYQTKVNFKGYNLSMDLTIRSSKVDLVEKISTTISELISSGLNISVQSPRYYYTKLNDLKTEMIKEAANDAYSRAQLIAEGGKKSLGELKSTSLGVFQIVGLYQNEEYSWRGSFNTASKEKMVSITVKANYILD